MTGFSEFKDQWGSNAQRALHMIEGREAAGIPSWMIHALDMPFMEEMTGSPPGSYRKDPHSVYLAFQKRAGACMIDQYIPDNPLSMGAHGYESDTEHGATTGAERILLDGIVIDSPEAVVEHLETRVFPELRRAIDHFENDHQGLVDKLIANEVTVQRLFGPNLLKVPYGGFQAFPGLRYFQYGYAHYLMAYALFPEVMEKDFSLQADFAFLRNRISARAILEGKLPPMVRLDHDMTDSRGTLVNIRSLEQIWFPHFARCIQPFHDAGIRLIWHCDGNVMTMVPRLIEAGISGFQGFQYETGVDYPAICRMKDRHGNPLLIVAGVSVTRTLPFGTPRDVRDEIDWLVQHGPRRSLFLGCSSSVLPGTSHENIRTMIEGFRFYREP